ncbi:hypothetical protein D3C87_1787030 [compost metagenome]
MHLRGPAIIEQRALHFALGRDAGTCNIACGQMPKRQDATRHGESGIDILRDDSGHGEFLGLELGLQPVVQHAAARILASDQRGKRPHCIEIDFIACKVHRQSG